MELWMAMMTISFLFLVLLLLLLMNRNKTITTNEMSKIRNEMMKELLDFQNRMLTSIHSDLSTLNEYHGNRITQMEHHVNEQLHTSLTQTNDVFQQVMQQMVKVNEAQSQLSKLGNDIAGLHQILNDKKSRGVFGETALYSLLENAFGPYSKQYAKQYQLSNHTIVDAVVFCSDNKNVICIDSKFPFENYNRLQESDIPASKKKTLINEFSRDVKHHIQTIADKYILPEETAAFAYLFLPSEAIFAYINANLDQVVQFSYEKKVYLVSPTTLMAYLTLMKTINIKQKKNEKMRVIQQELSKLAIEFERFVKRYEALSTEYDRTYRQMHDLFVTAEKISQQFKKIEAAEFEE